MLVKAEENMMQRYKITFIRESRVSVRFALCRTGSA